MNATLDTAAQPRVVLACIGEIGDTYAMAGTVHAAAAAAPRVAAMRAGT